MVVANFSDYATPGGLSDPNAEYVVHNWPAIAPGRRWREVTQSRDVLPWQVGREPIFPWEAKVYVGRVTPRCAPAGTQEMRVLGRILHGEERASVLAT